MAQFYSSLSEKLINFIEQQHIFFVATAPTVGRINLSPKGMDTLKVLSSDEIIWLNLTGSGNETAAHLLENGRMTVLLCSFSEKPLILRVYGEGKCIYPNQDHWKEYINLLGNFPGARQIVKLKIESVQTSCGFAVPYMEYKGERDQLVKWSENKGSEGIRKYWKEKNQVSIDNLPTGQKN